jgi:hypothetical protein
VEEQLAASLGRKTLELGALHAEYAKLLQLSAWMASGEVSIDRVKVDVTAKTWSLAEAQPVDG